MNEILATALTGLVAGALARFLMPGKQSMGMILTMVLGIVGAYVGSFVKDYSGFGGDGYGWTIGLATAGSVVVLFVVMMVQKIAGK